MSNPLVESFWDAALDGEDLDRDAYLAHEDDELKVAIDLHRTLREAGKRWRAPETPRNLGNFQVHGHLGSGGLGHVWLGWDPELQRHVAIKVIERDRWAMNEARSIARLDHRAVVKVYEVAHDRLVMELLSGGSLKDEIDNLRAGEPSRFITLKDRLHCLLHIAEGLEYCHERGVLHRDVKPGNVLFAQDDIHPRLIDFGLSHAPGGYSLDITQNLVGTPAYIAPEQVDAGETGADPRSDQFSFGVMAYELLTLENPFLRDTRTQTLDAVRQAHPPALRRISPEVPEPVQRIVQHCLELDPRRRYQDMKEVVSDLRDVLANRPISIGRRGVLQQAQLWYRRNRRLTRVGLSGVAVAALAGISLWGNSVHAARTQILREVDSIHERLPELSGSTEFNKAGLDLLVAQLRGEQFDRGRIGPLLFGSTRPEIKVTIDTWSQRLGEAAAAAEQAEPATFPAEAWKAVFQIDAGICPDGEWNREFRDRGRLVLLGGLAEEPELRLRKQFVRGPGYDEAFRDFRVIPLSEYLPEGYYRLELPGEWEREFVQLSLWGPPHEVERGPRRIPSGELATVPGRDGIAFSELILKREYQEFCDATGRAYPKELRIEGDFFQGTWNQAQDYAVWIGGRLPAGEEVHALLESRHWVVEDSVGGEYISDIAPHAIQSCLAIWYARLLSAKEAPPMAWVRQTPRSNALVFTEDPGSPRTGLRVVFPR